MHLCLVLTVSHGLKLETFLGYDYSLEIYPWHEPENLPCPENQTSEGNNGSHFPMG